MGLLRAERLGHDPNSPPIRLKGPAEVKMAETAFNDMQDRLRRYVADRTAMIGAVAHDLRTPLTRLRFRAESLDEPVRKKLAAIPEDQRWLVSSEGAFGYLTRDFGWREAYLWPINADEQGSPQQVRRLIDLMRKNRIPVVFSESTVSDKPARQVARETGARYGGVGPRRSTVAGNDGIA